MASVGEQCNALEATAESMEACFRQASSPERAGNGKERLGNDAATPVVPSGAAFDDFVSGRLATAVIRSLRFFRAAAAGTEAAYISGDEREERTPAVSVLADGSVIVDDGPRRVALAGLRLAGSVATAPGPARALLAAGGFHVLWRLPSDPAATPAGVALALGALCQGVRHADVLRVFLARWDGEEMGAQDGGAGLARLGGYEACALVLSGPVRNWRRLGRGSGGGGKARYVLVLSRTIVQGKDGGGSKIGAGRGTRKASFLFPVALENAETACVKRVLLYAASSDPGYFLPGGTVVF